MEQLNTASSIVSTTWLPYFWWRGSQSTECALKPATLITVLSNLVTMGRKWLDDSFTWSKLSQAAFLKFESRHSLYFCCQTIRNVSALLYVPYYYKYPIILIQCHFGLTVYKVIQKVPLTTVELPVATETLRSKMMLVSLKRVTCFTWPTVSKCKDCIDINP